MLLRAALVGAILFVATPVVHGQSVAQCRLDAALRNHVGAVNHGGRFDRAP